MVSVPAAKQIGSRLAEADAAGGDLAALLDYVGQRPSLKERYGAGKALRKRVPRADHARYEAAANRPDPVGVLEQQNETRVAKLVPVRFARMLASPFAFLRGSAAVMANDLVPTPVTGVRVQACGDMHVANFGLFGSAERNLVFAINDFDETYPGPWEWDLKRLAASAAVAARFVGGDKIAAADAARVIVKSYRRNIRRYAEAGYLSVWYERIDEAAVLAAMSPKVRRRAERVMDKAREKGHMQMLDRLTEESQGQHRIIEELPLIVRETHTEEKVPISVAINAFLKSYTDSLAYDRRHLLSRYRIRRRRPQGRRRRQCRDGVLDRPADGARQRGSVVPSGQGGRPVGARAPCRCCAKSSDAALIAGYCGRSDELDDAIACFAVAYEKQTRQDHDALDKARRTGRIQVAASEVVK